MIIEIEFSDEFIENLAMERYPELVKWSKCCSGRDCGCGGYPDADTDDAVERLKEDIIDDKSCFMEFVNEYEKHYSICEG